ncbi:ATP-binding protein [uncultured Paraglaciecola sp.]|uniref:ATP-binding protein n=1 Tax=uncultured Paraglaciecola sp. TaxID=1765024 RepID=UPI0030D74A90|tara:strand:- start:74981 stop:77149 length:2169 start_codon:yes stop_codon:yes gene_type:complete
MNRFHLSKVGYVTGCILILIIGLATLWYSYLAISKQVISETNTSLTLQSNLKGAIIEQTLINSIRHTGFIYATPPIAGITRAVQNDGIDILENTEYGLWVKRLESIFLAYVENNPDIVQIRFIGKADKGRELVRVHRRGDKIEAVRGKGLQQKYQRDYFQNVQTLPLNQLYISEITLNREYGKIEQPPWPTYRIAQPVFDEKNQFFGLVIINFNAQILLDKLPMHANSNFEFFLLNEIGQYLLHPNKAQSFSFEYGDLLTWKEDAQNITQKQQSSADIQTIKLNSTNGIYSVSQYPVHMTVASHVPPLTLIAAINHEEVNNLILQRYGTSVLFNIGLILLAFVLLTLYRLYSHASFLRLKVQAECEAIFQGSSDIIISINQQGEIDSWNHAALTFFAIDEGRMYRASIDSLIKDPHALTIIKQQIKAIFNNHKVDSLELQLSSGEQTDKVMSVAFSPVSIGNLAVSSVSAIFRDVTDASLLRKSLQDTNQKLESRNQEMQAFVYTVSHDLKSPLVTIGGFTERILDSAGERLDEKNRHRLTRIKVNVDHMSQLLADLLDLARIVRQKLEYSTCQLKSCVEKAQQSLNQSILDSGAEFELINGEQELLINAQLITQCLQNLFSNGINYAVSGTTPKIKIHCYQRNNLNCIAVSDNGMGIDVKHHQKIFKIFERLDVGKGSGVGLAIVKTIMEKHQGWVELESTIGEGSTFTLCFPQQGTNSFQ